MATTRKYRSGYCGNGQHEGMKPKNHLGEPLKVCIFFDDCNCKCHEEITEMFKLAGLPREPQQNPEYLHKDSNFWLPGDDDDTTAAILSNSGGTSPHLDNESAVVAQQEPVVTPSYAPTPTGRKARGELESQVWSVCNDFVAGVFEWPLCLPKLVSEEIGKRTQDEPPSTGAINAVWERWVKLDFCLTGKKPLRFVAFAVEDHSWSALMRVKARYKREKKRSKSAMKRGYRPAEV